MLHITNGDSTRLGLEQSGLPGTIQPWRDVLYDGPVPTHLPAAQFRRVRSEFIASGGFGSVAEIERGYEQEDAAVASWETHDEMVLWFEHDLYDQLLLIRLLSMLPPEAGGKVSLVCSTTYLGPLPPAAFPALFAERQPITAAQVALGRRAWHAFGADTPGPLLAILDGDTSPLPFLDGALRRHLEDYPDTHGLSRSERQILQVLDEGDRGTGALFAAWTAMEERIFMGDWTFWGILRGLATGPSPLVQSDSRSVRLPAEDRIALTGAGRDVFAGRADRIALNGIDRWMGGVHVTPERPWRRPAGSSRPSTA